MQRTWSVVYRRQRDWTRYHYEQDLDATSVTELDNLLEWEQEENSSDAGHGKHLASMATSLILGLRCPRSMVMYF